MNENWVRGAVNGFEVWLTYAMTEYVFSTAAPAVLHRDKILDLGAWRGTCILFVLYAIVGVLTGLLSTLLLSRDLPPEQFDRLNRRHLGILMVAAYGFNLVTLPATSQRIVALIAAAILCTAILFNFRMRGARLSDSPLTVMFALLLTGRLSFVTLAGFTPWLAVPAILLAMAAVLSICLFLVRLSIRVRASEHWTPRLSGALSVAFVLSLIFGPSLVSFAHARDLPQFRDRGPASSSPNIVLITLDTVRADHMGIYGYSRQNTPNLSRLAEDAYVYTRFISVSPITLTSHASIFTGYYPRTHGAYKQIPEFPMGHPLPESIPTLASILSRSGYRSVGIAANHWYLGPEWGLMRGFDYAFVPVPVPLIEDNSYFVKRSVRDLLLKTPTAADFYSAPAVDAHYITTRATSTVDHAHKARTPFFLFLNYMDAHWPYHSPSPFDTEYPGRSDLFSGADDEAALRTRIFLSKNRERVPREYIAHMTSQYDGAIKYIDSELGRLIEYLKAVDLYDNTMIVVTADHGEALGEWNEVGHNISVHYDQINIPLIVKYPGRKESKRIGEVASQVDLLPTILEAAGIPAPQNLPGLSLLRLDAEPERLVFSECHYGPIRTPTPLSPVVQYAVVGKSYKLVKTSSGENRLFDLMQDPTEQVEARDPQRFDFMNLALAAWIRKTIPVQGRQQGLNPDQLKRLRSLGYLQ